MKQVTKLMSFAAAAILLVATAGADTTQTDPFSPTSTTSSTTTSTSTSSVTTTHASTYRPPRSP
jgi:uncharacterized lipoprotein YbaY